MQNFRSNNINDFNTFDKNTELKNDKIMFKSIKTPLSSGNI